MIGHTLRLISAYILKNRKMFLLGLILGVVVVFGVIYLFPKVQNGETLETIGVVGNVTVANLPNFIQEKISYGLTAASESYFATDSGKTWVFKIKPNLYWQDGNNFTAYDVNYQLADVKITPLDTGSVRFDLAGPFAPLPSVVSQPLFKPGLVGLGEFKVKTVKTHGRFLQNLLITSNKTNISYKFYPTENTLKTAFKLGEIDKVVLRNISGLGDYKNTQTTNYREQAIAFFDTKDGPTADKSFRQALLYSSDEITKYGTPSAGPIPPNSWAYNPNLKIYKPNVDLATKLLAKQIASGEGKLKITSTLELYPVAEELQKMWSRSGLQVEVETSDVKPENFDVYLTYVEMPQDPDQYQLWHSTSGLNISSYKSPKSDKLLEEGRQETNEKLRKQKYFDWQKAITEDAPAAFLYFPYIYTVSRR